MTTRKQLTAVARTYGCASLLSVNADSKTVKGSKVGYLTGVLYMMPDDRLCPMSHIAGCRKPCLVSAGRAQFTPGIGRARAGRTAFFHGDRDAFMALLMLDIAKLVKRAKREGKIPAVRLNGTSDINWSKVTYQGKSMFEHYPDVQFYDYTKSPSILRAAAGERNWHVTASYSGASGQYSQLIRAAAGKYGANLAVVYRGPMPTVLMGQPVVNGDENDLRFLDPAGVVVALKAKGSAKQDNSGFVVDMIATA